MFLEGRMGDETGMCYLCLGPGAARRLPLSIPSDNYQGNTVV